MYAETLAEIYRRNGGVINRPDGSTRPFTDAETSKARRYIRRAALHRQYREQQAANQAAMQSVAKAGAL